MFEFERVSQQFQEEFDSLLFEVRYLADLFRDTNFLGSPRNFEHAHYGYLMACMGRLDQYSLFWRGPDAGSQTQRMIDFLAHFVFPIGELDHVHSVVVQMFRHSLMHTGALRFAYDRREQVGYTWRVHFGVLPPNIEHYSITPVDPQYQDRLLATLPADARDVRDLRAINLSIPSLVDNLYGGVGRYMHELRESAELQRLYLQAEAYMNMQVFTHRPPTPRPAAPPR
jgi:hypothetical protein